MAPTSEPARGNRRLRGLGVMPNQVQLLENLLRTFSPSATCAGAFSAASAFFNKAPRLGITLFSCVVFAPENLWIELVQALRIQYDVDRDDASRGNREH